MLFAPKEKGQGLLGVIILFAMVIVAIIFVLSMFEQAKMPQVS